MRTVQEYRHHAEECHKLAQSVKESEWRGTFEQMAQTWEMLANLRQHDLKAEEK